MHDDDVCFVQDPELYLYSAT